MRHHVLWEFFIIFMFNIILLNLSVNFDNIVTFDNNITLYSQTIKYHPFHFLKNSPLIPLHISSQVPNHIIMGTFKIFLLLYICSFLGTFKYAMKIVGLKIIMKYISGVLSQSTAEIFSICYKSLRKFCKVLVSDTYMFKIFWNGKHN